MKRLVFWGILLTSFGAYAGKWCSFSVLNKKKERIALIEVKAIQEPRCSCKYSPADMMRDLKSIQAQTAGQVGKYSIENEKKDTLELLFSIPFQPLGVASMRKYYYKSKSACKKGIEPFLKEFKPKDMGKYE